MKANETRPAATPRMTKPASSMGDSAGAGGMAASGTKKAGSSPNTSRAIEVAVAVATTTGRKVRFDTSGSNSSTANITPPSGVLKVAAMPAPAPADSSVIFCQRTSDSLRASVEPNEAPIWMIGPSRPTEAPEPIEIAEASDFTMATMPRTFPLL